MKVGGNKISRVAVLIPCYNEGLTIFKVVSDFKEALPAADIYVFDNNSRDDTVENARAAGATVFYEKRQGKGYVLQSMFMAVDADYCILVDGDDTYPAKFASDLLRPVMLGQADMVIGTRLHQFDDKSFRPFHIFGNKLVSFCINFIFKSKIRDAMSGYRAFSRSFMLDLPVISRGFEVETELTLQALYRGMILKEIPVPYGKRPEGSFSKLNTFRDGFKVLLKIFNIFKAYRPLFFFGALGIVIFVIGFSIGLIPVFDYLRTGLVPRLPTAVLAGFLEVVGIISAGCGVVLDSIKHHFNELSHLTIKLSRQTSGFRHEEPVSMPPFQFSDRNIDGFPVI